MACGVGIALLSETLYYSLSLSANACSISFCADRLNPHALEMYLHCSLIVVSIRRASSSATFRVRPKKSATSKASSRSIRESSIDTFKDNTSPYVQVRAYAKDSDGNKVYGKWSAKKNVKIEK